jgi:hypothetical protein
MAFVCALREKLSLGAAALLFLRAHLFNSPVPLAADWYGRESNQSVIVCRTILCSAINFSNFAFCLFSAVNFSFRDSSVMIQFNESPRTCSVL